MEVEDKHLWPQRMQAFGDELIPPSKICAVDHCTNIYTIKNPVDFKCFAEIVRAYVLIGY